MQKVAIVGLACLVGASALAARAEDADSLDFLNMSLRDLADQEVTSASRKEEKASEVAAAIYVITPDMIHRSGARHLPELLRHVPGLNVARAGSSQWAISARGFNDQFSNKLLVLLDGRTLYSPNFSGVWWDAHLPVLEDVERIEVIRGPGASVWGANAVNGVINIITKSAVDTQGSLAVIGAGNQERLNTQLRHGLKIKDGAYMRVYGAYQKNDEQERASASMGNADEWDHKNIGFRGDFEDFDDDTFMLQGAFFQSSEDQNYWAPITTAPYARNLYDSHEVQGANILGRWKRELSEQSEITLQSYLDYNYRDIAFNEARDMTLDVDFQHLYHFDDERSFNWGLGYRMVDDDFDGGFELDMVPEERTRHYYSGFVQYKTPLFREDLQLTLGSKVEHNPFSHGDVQPNVRLAWLVDEHQTLWGAISRAIRTPDRANHDVVNSVLASAGLGTTNVFVRTGNNNADTEKLTAYELGYRIQPRDDLSFDLSTFYNDYDDLLINSTGTPRLISSGVGAPYTAIPVYLRNAGSGYSYGGEFVANWQALDSWGLEASYSYLAISLDNGLSSTVNTEYKSPEHQIGLHSSVDLPHQLQWDQDIYYTSHIGQNRGAQIDDYLRLDMRLGYEPIDGVEFSILGENLLDNTHPEFGPFLYNYPAEIGRAFYGQLTLRF